MYLSRLYNLSLRIILGFVFCSFFLKPTLALGQGDCDSALSDFLLSDDNPIKLQTLVGKSSYVAPSHVKARYSEFRELNINGRDWVRIVESYMRPLKAELLGAMGALWQPDIEIAVRTDWIEGDDSAIQTDYPYNTATFLIDLNCILCNYFEVTLIHELVHLLTLRSLLQKWPAFRGIEKLSNEMNIAFKAYAELISDIIPMYHTKGNGDEIALSILEEISVEQSQSYLPYSKTMKNDLFRLRSSSKSLKSQEIFNFFKSIDKISEHHLAAKARSHVWLRLQALSPQLSLKEVYDLLIDTTVSEMVRQYHDGSVLSSVQIVDLTLEQVSSINDSFIDTFEDHLSNLLKAK